MRTEPETGSGGPVRSRLRGLAFRRSFRIPKSEFRTGFTLVELLVVIAIIAILAGLLMPAISSALTKAHESSTQNLIHQCEIAATGFFNDHGQYPPSTWLDMFNMLKYDANGDGTFDNADLTLMQTQLAGGFAQMNPDGSFSGGYSVNPGYTNEGIEVFLACVASKNGGPYMQPADWQLKDTDFDGDDNNGDVAKATNWYFGGNVPQPLFELADWWGNPLVYINNRDYAATDGLDDVTGNPLALPTPGNFGEWVPYATTDGALVMALSRDAIGFKTQTSPGLDSYQLYSLGSQGTDNNKLAPIPDVNGDGIADFAVPPDWNLKQMDFLANWEE